MSRIPFVFIILPFLLINTIVFSYEFEYIPFQGTMKEISTRHFRIIFPKKYAAVAKRIALYAEDIHNKLYSKMHWLPYQKTNIILSDHIDFPNGDAITFFRNTIHLYLVPSDLTESLESYKNPLYTLLTHEYTHILHIDQARGPAWFWRFLFGKLYMPVSGTFRWYLEGMAVLNESLYSQGGRLHANYNDAIIRVAAKNKVIPSFDRIPVVSLVDKWPYGRAVYHYGSRFCEYLYKTYGKEKYDEIFLNISDDFWPFVFMFVTNFKKIYGKSLDQLWNEWIKYEEKEATKFNIEILPKERNQITKTYLDITTIENVNNQIFYSTINGNLSKLKKIDKDDKNRTIKKVYIDSLSKTNNNDIVLYSKFVSNEGSFYYFDLFSYNLKTKIEKKLTTKFRCHYLSFAKKSTQGVIITHDGLSSNVYLANFKNNKLSNKEKINLPSQFSFVGQPSINDKGTMILFPIKLKTGEREIFLYDIQKKSFKKLVSNSACKKSRWINNSKFSYVGTTGKNNALFVYDMSTDTSSTLVTTIGNISDGIVIGQNVYFVDYTLQGQNIFRAKYEEMPIDEKFVTNDNIKGNYYDFNISDAPKIKPYNPARYILPPLWGILPVQIASYAYFNTGTGYLPFPLIAPQFYFTNSFPLGRFSYTIGVTLDYMKWYPNNFLSFSIKIPGVNIFYQWYNAAGGRKDFVVDSVNSSYYIEQTHPWKFSAFPINFNNYLQFSGRIPIGNYGILSWLIAGSHYFYQYDFQLNRSSNRFSFNENISYYYIEGAIPHGSLQDSRWSHGVFWEISSIQSPHYMVNTTPQYLLKTQFIGKYPIKNKVFFFGKINAGIDLLLQNSFIVQSDVFRFAETISGIFSSNFYNKIDIKSVSLLSSTFPTGSTFVTGEAGFDISFIKKTKYIHFGTLVFREFSMSIYNQILFLYNDSYNNSLYKGILFDLVIDLSLDFFVAYGNIRVKMDLGGALGYKVGDTIPSWNVFFYLSSGL